MIESTPSLTALLRQLQKVPYLASKNLYLVAQYFLELDKELFDQFCESLVNAKKNIHQCSICWSWKERTGRCTICETEKRNKRSICVVETWRDLIALEKVGCYTGVYHVLGGSISPLEGLGPEDLTLGALFERVKGDCEEVILALNQTPEGEATASYIASKLRAYPLKVTCLARGLPVGSSLDSTDRITISKALMERRDF